MSPRAKTPKLTNAETERAIECFQRLGGKLAAVEATPGKLRLISTDGQALTVAGDDDELDRELNEHLARHGHSAP